MKAQLPALHTIAKALQQAHIEFALGGSGLMAALGCPVEVHDWDLTTEAEEDQIFEVIKQFSHQRIQPNGIYASRYLYKIEIEGTPIDLIGSFALRNDQGKVETIPSTITSTWNGVPLGSPEAWVRAYQLLGRLEKANMLSRQIQNRIE